ncbi:MAG: Ig-like domain-containing protein [Prevotella sp.]|nr:Ig-like domain-containing protein [Prevotella sp.]
MKRLIVMLLALCTVWSVAELKAQKKWVDVTDNYIVNPSFENGANGWSFIRQHISNGSSTLRAGAMECWNDAFRVYQTIVNLPAGDYRLSANAFYRISDNSKSYAAHQDGTENITAYLYAGEDHGLALHSLYDYEFPNYQEGCWYTENGTGYYSFFANTMETAVQAFNNGGLMNTIQFTHQGGNLEIGIFCDDWQQDCWCLWDNFKLECYQEQIYVTSVSVTLSSETISVGKSLQLSATVLPENASIKKVTWISSNESVATVDATGLIKAKSAGTVTITATSTDGTNRSGKATITVAAKQRPEGDYSWIDVTNKYIVNPGFDNNSDDGWTFGPNKRIDSECMEFWNVTSDVYQVIHDLPAGWYRFSVQGFYREGQMNDQAYSAYLDGTEQITGVFYAGDDEQDFVSIFSDHMPDGSSTNGTWGYRDWDTWETILFPNSMATANECFLAGKYHNEMEFEHAGGDLRIGIRNSNGKQNCWCIVDNFKLEDYTTLVPATSVSVTPTTADLVVGQQVQLTATVRPATASYQDVEWKTLNAGVATVDENGVVTAVSNGTAYIQATAVDGSGKYGRCRVTVTRNKPTSESLIINEVMASNVDQYISPAYNFDGWVELYNPTDQAVEISNLYLSDDNMNLKKWRTPSAMGALARKGYCLIWFDSNTLHPNNAPFKLDEDGGTLYVSDDAGKLITSITYPAGKERASYARTTDGGAEWGWTDQPTPKASNASSAFAEVQLGAPEVDQPSQIFMGNLTVNVVIPAGTTLRYTTDGSLPTPQNGVVSTTGQFSVTETAIYRFRLFGDNYLASPVTSRSYIYRNLDYSLPSISVVTDRDFLYDDMMGIYVNGTNGRPGNGQSTAKNYNMDWDRPVNFSYLNADGQMVFNQDVNMSICGGWSRANYPHSFKLKGNKELGGDKKLPYPFFSAKPFIRNRTLQIRGGGNDNSSRIIDPAVQTIIQTSEIDIDGQSYQPTHLFLNGEYMGVMNMREPNNKHFVFANYGWDDDEIDQFEQSPDSGYVQMCGTREAFDELVNLTADAANPETYEEIRQLLDVDEYINYMACGFYLRRNDWIRNNVKGYRHQDGGRFRFVNYDLDGAPGGFTFDSFMSWEYQYRYDKLYPSGTYIYQDNKLVTLFKNLLQNPNFKQQFIDTYCVMGGSVFEPERCNQIIDSLVATVAPAMQLTGMYPSTASSLKNSLSNQLDNSINMLRGFSTFGLYNTTPQTVVLRSDVPAATLYVNDVKVTTGYFNGKLFAPTTLRAVAPAGYIFQGWQSSAGSTTEKTIFDKGSSWRYYDNGSLDGANWTAVNYNASGWNTGYAPLGYEKDGISTTLSYGMDSQHKYPTYYFRRNFGLDAAPTASDVFRFNYTIDDGFIVYVNGQEAGRYNMPSGTVTYDSFSTTYAHSNPDVGTIELPASLFHSGSNVIAVEVHNNSASSTDILFDASLTVQGASAGSVDYYSTDAEIPLPNSSYVSLTACYKPMSAAERKAAAINPVRINEVSGSNDSYINEYFKKNDWVELYNTTDEEIDIEGMYLSDNISKLMKYQISKEGTSVNTKIPAHGHLIIWCDKLNTTDQALHASFKIDGDGGELFLTAADKSWTDTLAYSAHDARTTIGRYPDGAADVYAMSMPTINKQNLLTSYAQREEAKVVNGLKPAVYIAAANGFRIRYAGGSLILKAEDADYARVEIYTASGQSMMEGAARIHGGVSYVDVSELPSGFYIARAVDSNGNRVSCKFMK